MHLQNPSGEYEVFKQAFSVFGVIGNAIFLAALIWFGFLLRRWLFKKNAKRERQALARHLKLLEIKESTKGND